MFRLPSTCFAEEDGSLTSSGRVLQWHWKGAPPPGEAKQDADIVADIFLRIRNAYVKDGGAYPDPIVNLTWDYKIANAPSPEELAKEYNGKALVDLVRSEGPRPRRWPRPASCCPASPCCATTARRPAAAGSIPAPGRKPATRWAGATTPTPYGIGQSLGWAWAWPANRRILYNGASVDPKTGKPWIRHAQPHRLGRQGLRRLRHPRYRAHREPGRPRPGAPVHHDGRGRGPHVRTNRHGRRAAARALRAVRVAARRQPHASEEPEGAQQPGGARVQGRPRVDGDRGRLSLCGDELPPHRALPLLDQDVRTSAIIQPEQFVEIGEELAKEKGIKDGDRVKVEQQARLIKAVANVSKRNRLARTSTASARTPSACPTTGASSGSPSRVIS